LGGKRLTQGDHGTMREEIQGFVEFVERGASASATIRALVARALRWEEMREYLADLLTKAVARNDWRGVSIWNHLLDAFSDDWDDAAFYKEFGGG
jgi:hypothetical protein